MHQTAQPAPAAFRSAARATCPPWCVTGHGMQRGEEDWLHLSEPLTLTEGVSAQLCMSIDPCTGAEDGPYVVVGGTEYTLPEAQALAATLMTMASLGDRSLSASGV